MAKPPTSTRTIRLPVSEWERLQRESEVAGITINALVARKVGSRTFTVPTVDENEKLQARLAVSRRMTGQTITENRRQFTPHPRPGKK